MPNISIISPDPELRRMLEITLELKGASVKACVNADFRGEDPAPGEVAVIDLAGFEPPLWKGILASAMNRRCKTAVILPRGHRAAQKDFTLARADLVVKRPFELMDLAEKILSMTGKDSKQKNIKKLQREKNLRR